MDKSENRTGKSKTKSSNVQKKGKKSKKRKRNQESESSDDDSKKYVHSAMPMTGHIGPIIYRIAIGLRL